MLKSLFLALPVLLFASCQKHAAACVANCGVIYAKGIVENGLTKAGAPNAPVTLSWGKFNGLIEQDEIIAKVSSKSDGSFGFSSSIDTTYFSKGYFLNLHVNSNNEYIILSYTGTISQRVDSFNSNALQNVQFVVFNEANLAIRMHRVQTDSFQTFTVSHSLKLKNTIGDSLSYYDFLGDSPAEIHTSQINVSTVADIYTTITAVKMLNNDTTSLIVDSIKCVSGSLNVYDLYF